jgi:hypothetical protein
VNLPVSFWQLLMLVFNRNCLTGLPQVILPREVMISSAIDDYKASLAEQDREGRYQK